MIDELDILRDELVALERELHDPHTWRTDRALHLLHAEFVEFGSSGTVYTRTAVTARLSEGAVFPRRHSQDFEIRCAHEGVVLLTYRSAEMSANGEFLRHTLRSSLWDRGSAGWQIRFHQGTFTQPFDVTATSN